MPEIDTDLFNFLVVAFLAILVIASVVALSLLGGVKKALDALARRDGDGAATASTTTPPVAAASTPLGSPEDARAAEDAQRARADEDAAEARRQADEARRAEEAERAESERAAEDERRRREDEERRREDEERARLEQAERDAGAARAAEEREGAAAEPAAAAAQPQEQPFERDGRWWFRRGDELLVYDERAQEWVPAPSETPDAPDAGADETAAAPSESAGSFWKCPSCGAVNGSTATTCRMCFSARP